MVIDFEGVINGLFSTFFFNMGMWTLYIFNSFYAEIDFWY